MINDSINDLYWQAFMARDEKFDGKFYVAVSSTGIYCRPSCPARRPKRENVHFYASPDEAEQAGFRPCLRCHPRDGIQNAAHVELVQAACEYIENHLDEKLSLTALSGQFHLSPYHFQRVFKRVAGLSPRQYAAAHREVRLRSELKQQPTVTGALYAAGYQSSSSLYEQVSGRLGMPPSVYQKGGEAMEIRYTLADCSLGRLLVAATGKGICAVSLGDADVPLIHGLEREYPAARLSRDDQDLAGWVKVILASMEGNPDAQRLALELPLDVQATVFQQRVWQALRQIPAGFTRTYTQVARSIGQPSAVRAVARACATNPVALIVPCHRVLRSDGSLGGYRWGLSRKQALLHQEEKVKLSVG